MSKHPGPFRPGPRPSPKNSHHDYVGVRGELHAEESAAPTGLPKLGFSYLEGVRGGALHVEISLALEHVGIASMPAMRHTDA